MMPCVKIGKLLVVLNRLHILVTLYIDAQSCVHNLQILICFHAVNVLFQNNFKYYMIYK